MARTTGSDGERTEALLREAAARLIARHGYEAMTMRQLAAEIGVQAAALYRYFPTKEDLLFTLMREHMEWLIDAWEAARPAASDPTGRLAAETKTFVEATLVGSVPRMTGTTPYGATGDVVGWLSLGVLASAFLRSRFGRKRNAELP